MLSPWQTARFVQHENVRLLRQRSRNQHSLLFATGKRGKVLSGNALHAHKAQDIAGNLFILRYSQSPSPFPAASQSPAWPSRGRKGVQSPGRDEYDVLLRVQGAVDVLVQRDLAVVIGADELFLPTCRDAFR